LNDFDHTESSEPPVKLEHLGTPWNTLEHLGTPWNTLEHLGTPWEWLEVSEKRERPNLYSQKLKEAWDRERRGFMTD